MSSEETWKRRERALGAGAVTWALTIAFYVAVWPEELATHITTADPLVLAGSIMVSIGLLAGFFETGLIFVDYYSTTHDDDKLTEVPWDE